MRETPMPGAAGAGQRDWSGLADPLEASTESQENHLHNSGQKLAMAAGHKGKTTALSLSMVLHQPVRTDGCLCSPGQLSTECLGGLS